ncbi:MAG: hypothetical protein CVU54_16635 [Deltaproteobacteria bacterium HGW-Deltaproteobacteria-12]|jgi:hypothetical protein|nr:MAG: hypothetical protein CVU54_16635 [Deltaproteobacteria bacterium HGW-Deltaproteobacteria-12]
MRLNLRTEIKPDACLQAVFIACLFIFLFSGSNVASAAGANPVIKMEYFGANWKQKPWMERLERAPDKLLEYLAYQNKLDGFSEVPSAVEPVPEIADVFKEISFSLSPALRKLLEERLIGVFCVKDLGSSGFTEEVVDEVKGRSYAVIVLDRDVLLKRKANDWATWKENSIFLPAQKNGFRLQMIIESEKNNTVHNAMRYLLLHELGHTLGMISNVHPSWIPADKTVSLDYPFVRLSWRLDAEGKPVSLFDELFPERKKIKYYAFAQAQLTNDQVPDAYAQLQFTNFVSMQAAANIWEDFAESFVTYVHVLRGKQPWQLRIESENNPPAVVDSCWQEKRCAEKKYFLDKWFDNPCPES